jgi:hypothetical protein
MKPDWKDAPKWASHLAMDENGQWWWFENEPLKSETCWYTDLGKIELAFSPYNHWEKSPESRPE